MTCGRLELNTGPGHGASADPEPPLHDRGVRGRCLDGARRSRDQRTRGLGRERLGGHLGVIFAATSPARCRTLVTLGTPVQASGVRERVETLLLLLLYRLLGPARFIQNGVVDTMLPPRTRAEDRSWGNSPSRRNCKMGIELDASGCVCSVASSTCSASQF